jgi:hypothetical protein
MSRLDKANTVAAIAAAAGGLYDAWWQRRQRKRETVKQQELAELRQRIESLEQKLAEGKGP